MQDLRRTTTAEITSTTIPQILGNNFYELELERKRTSRSLWEGVAVLNPLVG